MFSTHKLAVYMFSIPFPFCAGCTKLTNNRGKGQKLVTKKFAGFAISSFY